MGRRGLHQWRDDSAREIIARCKRVGLTIVAGRPMFTTERDGFADVDHLVLNEAELTLPLFLADFAQGHAKPIYSTTEFDNIRQSPMSLWVASKTLMAQR